jgi:hypothetical protein
MRGACWWWIVSADWLASDDLLSLLAEEIIELAKMVSREWQRGRESLIRGQEFSPNAGF